jgi:hypothetical protein
MLNPQCFDPSLLAKRKADEKTELDQLSDGELPVQLIP